MGTSFTLKPSGAAAVSMGENHNIEALESGGNKGGNSGARYRFTKHAFNQLINWLLLDQKYKQCVHFVFTIPSAEYYQYQYEPDQKAREHYWQYRVKKALDAFRYRGWLSESKNYAWFKEYNKQGILHWHFLHWGQFPPAEYWDPRKTSKGKPRGWRPDLLDANAIWSNIIRPTSTKKPAYPNALRSRNDQRYLSGASDAAKYFGKYFQKGQNDRFYTKAYHIPSLPDELNKGGLKVGFQEFNYAAGQKKIAELDYATVFAIKIDQYEKLLNQKVG